MSQHEILVKPLGLVTRPNIYGQYPVGALKVAQNCVMRSPGILENAPGILAQASGAGAIGDTYTELFPLVTRRVMKWMYTAGGVWTVWIDSSACVLPSGFSTTNLFSTTGRIEATRARDRVFFSSNQGDLVLDSEAATLPATLRDTGIAQPQIYRETVLFSPVVYTALNQVAGYAVVIRRVYSDGYEIQSVPSPVYRVQTGDTSTTFTISVALPEGMIAGDLIELFRTARIDDGTSTTDPGTTLNLIKTAIYDGVATSVTLLDEQQFGELGQTAGKALYTNPGQEGSLNSNRIPNLAKCVAMFKNHRFLGNVTERPQINVQAYAGWGMGVFAGVTNEAAIRAAGVGQRFFAGTKANLNATITGITSLQMLGLAIGQFVAGTGVAGHIVSVGANSITLDATASGSGAVDLVADDLLVINGVEYAVRKVGLTIDPLPPFEITGNQCVNFGDPKATSGYSATIEPNRFKVATSLVVKATNGALYNPPLPTYSQTAKTFSANVIKNGINWSKDSQPEHFPSVNEDQVGHGEIIAFESTRDALWVFCTDGLFRLSGDAGQWRVDTVDTTCILSAPRASCVLREVVYAYCNCGFVRITDSGVETLSERVVADLLPGAEYKETAAIILACNEADGEIVIRLDATQTIVYNTRENAYTTIPDQTDVTAMAYARYTNTGSQVPLLLLARTIAGQIPTHWFWSSTAVGSNYPQLRAQFQPVFGGEPITPKQWVDCVYIFDSAAGQNFVPTWNGLDSEGGLIVTKVTPYNSEARFVAGVPRRAAIGNTIVPGFYRFNVTSTTPTRLYGISLRYRDFGGADQNLHR